VDGPVLVVAREPTTLVEVVVLDNRLSHADDRVDVD
jgi:hypothetical protein